MNRLLGTLLFVAIALGILGGAHYYLYRRLVADVVTSPAARRVLAGVFVALLASLVTWPFLARARESALADAWSYVAFLWMGLGFYLTITLGLSDVVRLATEKVLEAPVDPARRLFVSQAVAAGATTVAAAATGFGVYRAYAAPEITEVGVKLAGLPPALSGLTIAQLSDIHVGPSIKRRFLEDMVERVNALKPDLVAITGDLMDGSVARLGRHMDPLAKLQSRFGTFFITGNHEYYSGDVEWCAFLERMGMQVLRNRHVTLQDGKAALDVVGVDDWSFRHQERGYDLARALAGRDDQRPAVLLAHQPRGFEQAAANGVGLQLSGHTHGGQFWPWNFAVRSVFPHIAGRYDLAGGTLYVSRGTGFWGPQMRLGAPPEIVKVVLG